MRNPENELKIANTSGKEYSFLTADGIESKNNFRDSELIIIDNIEPGEGKILVAEANYGLIGVILGEKNEGETILAETSDRAARLCQINIDRNNVEASVEKKAFYTELDSEFEKAFYAPKAYEPTKLVKHRIAEIIELLKDEGELFLAGKNKAGIKRYANFLKKLDGELVKVDQEGPTRLYRYEKESKVELPEITIENEFKSEINDHEIEFVTCEGLFSYSSLDEASKFLIKSVEAEHDEDILDLCCGYGAIGIWLNKLYGCNLTFSDDSNLATHFTEKNLEKQGLNSEVKNGDCLEEVTGKFDRIVMNPPTHQGSGITDELFSESKKHLKKNGEIFIVYNKNMNYERKFSKIYPKTENVGEQENFKLLRAYK